MAERGFDLDAYQSLVREDGRLRRYLAAQAAAAARAAGGGGGLDGGLDGAGAVGKGA